MAQKSPLDEIDNKANAHSLSAQDNFEEDKQEMEGEKGSDRRRVLEDGERLQLRDRSGESGAEGMRSQRRTQLAAPTLKQVVGVRRFPVKRGELDRSDGLRIAVCCSR